MRPLLKALRTRIHALKHTKTTKDKLEIYLREDIPFLQLEIRRDHMLLDLWLPPEKLEEARASGIARAHPFMGQEAVKVRFERAEDLTRVARWLEDSFDFAPKRSLSQPPTNGADDGGAKVTNHTSKKKTATKKAPAKKTTAKKAPAKKAPAKKTSRRSG